MDNTGQENENSGLPTELPVATPTQLEIMAVIILSVSGVAGVVLLFALQVENAIALSAIILGFLAPTIVALLSLRQAKQNSASVERIRVSIDGRLTQLLETTKAAAKAEGIVTGLTGDERKPNGTIADRKVNDLTTRREGE